jgi:hypothetical protein
MVLASWERKWLDPDYDMATHRYKTYDDEDDEDEFVDDEIDDAILEEHELVGGAENGSVR